MNKVLPAVYLRECVYNGLLSTILLYNLIFSQKTFITRFDSVLETWIFVLVTKH